MSTEHRFVSLLSIAMSNCSLYSADHALTEQSLEKALAVLESLPGDRLELMVVEGELVANKTAMKEAGIYGKAVTRRLVRKGLSRIDFVKGLTVAEAKRFLADVVDAGREPDTYPHVKTGAVRVRTGLSAGGEGVPGATEGLSEEEMNRLREIYHGISPFKKLEVAGLEEVVASFLVTIRREANFLRLISPVRAYSEYTYTHATNVALLAMYQADALGIGDDLLHDIGIAALLHDVGKLFVSREVLHKKGALEKEEFEEMMRHPVYGAYYLAKEEGLPHLAPIAAFEHHRKFDGSGYPKLAAGEKTQHLCSQIVAIADFFDALRSNRPYREGWEVKKILSMMSENSGKDFNPFLLTNFESVLLKSLGEA